MMTYLPLLTLAAGTVLGLISTLLISTFRQRQEVTLKLLEQYLEVRAEIADAVSDLTIMSLRTELDESHRMRIRNTIAKLVYRHWDFLPHPVVHSLVLLDSCLKRPDKGLYANVGGSVIPMPSSEVSEFLKASSPYRNARVFARMALVSRDPITRSNQAVVLHAKHVLRALNKFMTTENLLRMPRGLKKVW